MWTAARGSGTSPDAAAERDAGPPGAGPEPSRRQGGQLIRIVSLLPSATEILLAIGAGPDVVAVTHECDFPAGANKLPAITANAFSTEAAPAAIDRHIRHARHAGSSIYVLDAVMLAELEPDLILTQELCDVCAVAYREVEEAVRELPGQIPILSLEPGSLADIACTVEAVGRATGRARRAGALAAEMRARFATVALSRAGGPTPPRVVCVEWTDPTMVGGHWVPEMVAAAGGVDVLGVAGEPSRYVDWDEVVRAEPEVVVLMPCGLGLERTIELAGDVTGRPGFADLPAALQGRVAAVDGSAYFNRPGPRIADGLEILAAVIAAEPGGELPGGAAWIGSGETGFSAGPGDAAASGTAGRS